MVKQLTCYHADGCLLLALAVIRQAAHDRRGEGVDRYYALEFFGTCWYWIDEVVNLALAEMRR
ncbi:hypothetical protein KKH13_05220, partial [Patescibacteria group bacterium]|nr:hypothetical protein [Patescibacteria group bacterium]